jgi:predicted nucleotidyltransferase
VQQGVKKAVGTVLDLGQKAVKAAGMGAKTATTTGASRTIADTLERTISDQVKVDGEGNITVTEATAGDIAANAVKAVGNAAIEYGTEEFGGLGTKIVGNGVKKALMSLVGKKISKSAIGRAVGLIADNRVANIIKNVTERMGLHSLPEEVEEEIIGGILNAAFVGDQKMEDVFSEENLTAIIEQIVAQMGLFGVVQTGGGALGYGIERREAVNNLKAEREKLVNTLGEDVADYLERNGVAGAEKMLNTPGYLTRREAQVVMSYMDAAKEEQRTRLSQDRVEGVNNMETYQNAKRAAIEGKASAVWMDNADYRKGVEDGIADMERTEQESAEMETREAVSAITNKDTGNVVSASVTDGTGKAQNVNVISGNVVTANDGSVDREASSDAVVIRDENGDVRMVSPEELNDVQSEEAESYVQGVMQQRNAEIAANMAQIRAQYGLQTEGQQAQAQTEQALPQAETQTGQETAPEQPQAQQEPQEQAQQPTEEQAVPEYEMGDEVTFNGETATVVGFDEQNGMVQLQTSNGIIGVPPQALAQEQAQTESEQTQQPEAQQQEIPAEEQAAQPQEAEQAAAVPTDKEGNTDYDAIDDSAMMHDELQKEFGDEAESVLDEMIEEAEGQLAEAEKKKSVIERRRAQAKANARLNTLRGAKEVFAPQQTEQAQTEVPQAETEQEVEEKKNKKESGLPNEAKNASTLGSSAVSPEQDSESKGTESQAEKQANEKKSSIQGLENYTEDEIKELVMADIEQTLSDAGVEGVTIKGIALNGSRMRGDAREDSDLDVVVEYEGDMSEDGLFNILNENPVQIEGVKVDINPIKKGKSGSLDEYMERSRQYDAEKTAPKSAKVKSALDKVDELERLKEQKSEEQYKAREEART